MTGFSGTSRCGPGSVTLNATAVQGATAQWYAAANGGTPLSTGNSFTTPSLTANTSYYITAKTGNCESWPRQMVTVEIKPAVHVDLGSDINICVDGNDSVLLDAGALPDNPVYLWNDDFGEPSRHVSHSGTYILTVTNQYACKDVDTVDVTIKQNPVVSLGNDTNVCLGAAVLLDAKNPGNNHLWNTGAMVQQITAQSPGSYSVKVTTPENCFKSDTITVTMNGQFPVVDDIIITNNGNSTFTFTPYNPRHVMAYDWNFGDGTPNSNEQAPIHTYAIPGNYEVTLLLQSVCGSKTYTRSSNIVGIEQLNIAKEELLLSPNPAYGNTTIVNRGAFKMEQIEMYGIDGRLIYNEKADGAALHYLIQNIYRAEYL